LLTNKVSLTNRASLNEYNYQGPLNNTLDGSGLGLSRKDKDTESRSNRLNHFIKTQVTSIPLKEQLKANKQGSSKMYVVSDK